MEDNIEDLRDTIPSITPFEEKLAFLEKTLELKLEFKFKEIENFNKTQGKELSLLRETMLNQYNTISKKQADIDLESKLRLRSQLDEMSRDLSTLKQESTSLKVADLSRFKGNEFTKTVVPKEENPFMGSVERDSPDQEWYNESKKTGTNFPKMSNQLQKTKSKPKANKHRVGDDEEMPGLFSRKKGQSSYN